MTVKDIKLHTLLQCIEEFKILNQNLGRVRYKRNTEGNNCIFRKEDEEKLQKKIERLHYEIYERILNL